MNSSSAVSALIVDDNFYNRDVCALALSHVGYDVSQAENGAEALDALKKKSYDLLILDLAMPEISGHEVMETMRASNIAPDTKVIVMTANPHMVTSDIDFHADFVMHKPIDIIEFAQLAKRLVPSHTS